MKNVFHTHCAPLNHSWAGPSPDSTLTIQGDNKPFSSIFPARHLHWIICFLDTFSIISHDFLISPWCSYDFPNFPMAFLWFPHAFSPEKTTSCVSGNSWAYAAGLPLVKAMTAGPAPDKHLGNRQMDFPWIDMEYHEFNESMNISNDISIHEWYSSSMELY